MRTWIKVLLGIVAAVVLVVVGLGAGWLLWGRALWSPGLLGGPGRCAGWSDPAWRGAAPWGMGPGMMDGGRSRLQRDGGPGWASPENCPMAGGYPSAPSGISIEQAREAVEAYVKDLGYAGLEIAELMEFERNFYAIVRERDTGIGAMELLVDKSSGTVGPEMGPNMMWNARYGMHGRGRMMMGRTAGENALSEDQAVEIARRWLDANRPGVTTEEHADPFYGYYTIHTMEDGQIEGMLSVHGTTGQVWYHTWHGAFMQMIEEEEHS